jgi:hypothetical protein
MKFCLNEKLIVQNTYASQKQLSSCNLKITLYKGSFITDMAHRIRSIDVMTNLEIISRYRFDRDGIHFLDRLLSPLIQPQTARNHSLTSRDKILITLRYLATGPIQLNDADIHGISQPTISRVLDEVIAALSSPAIVQRFIKFPTTLQELTANQTEFYGLAHFPKVIGVIDGTHIKIKAPHDNEEAYVNRKGFHSINVQVVFDAFDKITDVVARWPGSTHDSRILQESGLKQLMEGGHLPPGQYHILGDSGYPCKTWLLTPYLNPQPGSQTSYNRCVLQECIFCFQHFNFLMNVHVIRMSSLKSQHKVMN